MLHYMIYFNADEWGMLYDAAWLGNPLWLRTGNVLVFENTYILHDSFLSNENMRTEATLTPAEAVGTGTSSKSAAREYLHHYIAWLVRWYVMFTCTAIKMSRLLCSCVFQGEARVGTSWFSDRFYRHLERLQAIMRDIFRVAYRPWNNLNGA